MKHLKDIFLGWSKAQKMGAVVSAIVVIVAGVGAVAYTQIEPAKPAANVAEDKKESVTKKKETKTVEYKPFYIYADSMEKDLNLYFLDDEDQRVTDTKLSVKLVKPENAKALEDTLTELENVNEAINSSEEDEEKTTDKSGNEKESDENEVSREETKSLLKRKTQAIDAYKVALDNVDGNVLTDEDADGWIYQKDMEPGEYVVCYVPTETYDAKVYSFATTVKNEVEHKVVDVSKKKVSYAAAGDTQGAGHNVTVEATLTDTIPWVDSTKKEVEEIKITDYKPAYIATVEGNNVTLYASSVGNSVDIDVVATAGPIDPTQIGASGGDAILKEDISAGLGTNYRLSIATNGVTETQDIPVVLSGYTYNVHVIGGAEPVVDEKGNQLYIDEAKTVPVTVGTYNPNTTYYVSETKTVYTGWQTIDGKRYYFDADGNPVTGKQIIGGVQYTFDSTGEVLTRSAGIDVSKWQGNIDWSQVKSAVSFAIVRAGFRGSSGGIAEDPKAGANIQGAKANGIKVGIYFYSKAMNEAQAVEEASLAVDIARKYGGVTLPIYIDMEDNCQLGLSTAERNAIVMAFCNTVRSAGYTPGVYANKNWFTNYLTPSAYGNVSIWLAQYNTQVTYSGRYDIWQYSSKGSIPGISGNVDLNQSFF